MIKKTILLCVFVFTINNLVAQENIVKVGAIVGDVGLQYERSLSEHFSLVGQVGYSRIVVSVNNVENTSNGLGYYIEGRYYFSSNKDLMEGWHIGPYFNSLHTKDNNVKRSVSSLGITGGYQWVLDSHITIGVFLGVGTLNFDSDNNLEEFFDGKGILPNLGLTLGYNF